MKGDFVKKPTNRKYNFFQRLMRAFRLNFIKLLRSPGGVKKISLGFALGFGLEMIVISTASLIYILFYPIVRLSGGSLPAAIIGNIIGKLTFLPIILIPFARKLGKLIYPAATPGGHPLKHVSFYQSFMDIFSGNFQALWDILYGGLHILIGMTIFGAILGFISYFVIYYLYEKANQNRLKKRSEMRRATEY